MTGRYAITGGTGTLGRALIRRLLADGADRVVSLSRDEVKAGELVREFGDHPNLRVFLGDVRDRDRLGDAFWGCEVVIHAAALKRVDQTSYNPTELVQTNILGTLNVIKAAMAAGVHRVILTSSDKAVHPTNPYGTSKQMAEQITVAMNALAYPRGTRLACTRYGNVLNSRGSVLEVWRRAQALGKPLPLTHPDMTRFILTPDAAAAFVLAVVDRMQGGEIFVPLLPAMRLVDLAEAFARGYPTEIVGVRPGGEKLHEVLVSDEEASRLERQREMVVIVPAVHAWSDGRAWGDPVELPRYASDQVGRLTVGELRELLCTVS